MQVEDVLGEEMDRDGVVGVCLAEVPAADFLQSATWRCIVVLLVVVVQWFLLVPPIKVIIRNMDLFFLIFIYVFKCIHKIQTLDLIIPVSLQPT